MKKRADKPVKKIILSLPFIVICLTAIACKGPGSATVIVKNNDRGAAIEPNIVYSRKKYAASPVVLRVKLIEQGSGSKYLWPIVEVLSVIKNTTTQEFTGQFAIAHYSFGPGLPDGISTVYLEPYGPADTNSITIWKMTEKMKNGKVSPGYSHNLNK